MELIPILSLIILVATISTFILAVGAYVLYKIRERKGKKTTAEQPATVGAELVTPTKVMEETRGTRTRRTATGEQIYTREARGESKYSTFTDRGQEMRPTFVAPRETRSTRTNATRYTAPVTRATEEGERYTSAQKFKRYSNPYNTKTEEVKKEESLRWR